MTIKTNSGYTLLFAVIVSSVVLSVAAYILSVSRKQFILSSAARESTVAIYAADSGIQCAVKAYSAMDQSQSTTTTSVNCNKVPFNIIFGAPGPATEFNYVGNVYKATFGPILTGDSCSKVTIYNGYINDSDGKPTSHKTVIESRGYNIYDSNNLNCPNESNPRVEERAIRLIYHD